MYITVYEKENQFYYVLNIMTLNKTWEKRFINYKIYQALVAAGVKSYDEKNRTKND